MALRRCGLLRYGRALCVLEAGKRVHEELKHGDCDSTNNVQRDSDHPDLDHHSIPVLTRTSLDRNLKDNNKTILPRSSIPASGWSCHGFKSPHEV